MKTLITILLTSLSFVTPLNSQAADHTVKMLNKSADGMMVFEPAVLKVNVGDKVTFVATDPTHDSISVFSPPGAYNWHGKRDQTISVEINKEGIYIYKCGPHFFYGMVGVIQAGKATNLVDAQTAGKAISRKFIANKKRLNDYLDSIK